MIFCHKPSRSPGTAITSREWARNTEKQASNQRFVADSNPEIRLNTLTTHSDSLAKESVVVMIENDLL